MKLPIYLDYSATTPVDPRVAQKMSECLLVDGNFGNPASRSHVFGWKAEESVENARRQVADLVNADPREIVWTSGATESDNLAIKGAAHFYATKCQGQGDCHQGDTCLTHHLWCDLSLQIHEFLSGISLADLVTRREVQEVAQRQDQRRCNSKAPRLDKIEASAVE